MTSIDYKNGYHWYHLPHGENTTGRTVPLAELCVPAILKKSDVESQTGTAKIP
jgi:hypothetical protein